MIRRHMNTHSLVHFVPALQRPLDFPDVAAMRAPYLVDVPMQQDAFAWFDRLLKG